MRAFSELMIALACMAVLPALAGEQRARDHKQAARVDDEKQAIVDHKKAARVDHKKAARVDRKKAARVDRKKAARVDRSGKVQKGEASFYGPAFYGKEMSNGEPMKPGSNSAASKTLPLGTKAEVTNLENGKRDVVVVEDRGPFVDGRIIDVSPKTARRLGFRHDGVAPVKVRPLELPPAADSGKKAPSSSATDGAPLPAAKRSLPPADTDTPQR